MNDISPTKNEIFEALRKFRGVTRGNVVYLAEELGICPQAVSKWPKDKPIPRVHILHLSLKRPELIGLLGEKNTPIEAA